jgi:hypothetical protein
MPEMNDEEKKIIEEILSQDHYLVVVDPPIIVRIKGLNIEDHKIVEAYADAVYGKDNYETYFGCEEVDLKPYDR